MSNNPYGYFGYVPGGVTYLHECPYCHAIHENKHEADVWCAEHADKKALRDKRGSNRKKWDWSWECPGCSECEKEA